MENAIKHGLEPKLAGGHITISARRRGDAIEVDVADDGLGFPQGASAGVGLANLRERLAALYGDGARLTIDKLAPGTCVRLQFPAEAP